MKKQELPDWYAPHIEAWVRLCSPSASVYLWNTAEGWALLHPLMLAHGWTFRALVTWVKTNGQGQQCTGEDVRTWPDVTEVCGFYQRNEIGPGGGPGEFVSYAAGASERNTIRMWLNGERSRAGLTGPRLKEAVNEAGGKGNMTVQHSFAHSQWILPTWDQWCALHAAWNLRGDPAGRPYLQRARGHVYDLADEADVGALRSEYDALRSEYDALRVPFSIDPGVTNVWDHPQVGGVERLKGADGKALHACQKPLIFADRMIRASPLPGELVLEPFGGTLRVALACERMEEKRRYVCVEPDEDGRGYVDAVLPSLRLDLSVGAVDGQLGLFNEAHPSG